MKISQIELFPVVSKLPSPLRWGAFEVDEKSCIILKLTTDDGVIGVGECGLSTRFYRQVKATVNGLIPSLIGKDAEAVGALWHEIYSSTHQWGRRGVETYALSGIDIALWDVLGKSAGKPIHALFGTTVASVPAYYAPDLKPAARIAEESAKAAGNGFGAIKLRTGLGLEEDKKIIREVRNAVGDSVTLMVDPNMAYDLTTGIRMARFFEEHGIYWIEEPVRTHSLIEYVRVLGEIGAHTSCYVAGGESLFTPYEFTDLISKRAVDVVQPDCTTSGGLTAARKISAMAEAWNVAFVPHVACSSIATIGLAAALHAIGSSVTSQYVEYDPYVSPLRQELLEEPLRPNGEGLMAVPEGPGLGINLNWEAVKHYALDE